MKRMIFLGKSTVLSLMVFAMVIGIFAGEKKITLDNERLSVLVPDRWQRGVPSEGYSLLFGLLEPEGQFRANISLMITNIPGLASGSFTLEDLFKVSKANLDKTFQSTYSNLKQMRMEVLNKEILAIKYDVINQKGTMSCKQYYVFQGENRYLFTAVATKRNFNQYEADFDSIVKSLRFF